MATATSGATTTFAGTLASEIVPKIGSRNGNVASCAAIVAARATPSADRRCPWSNDGRTTASANDAATESRKPSVSSCPGSSSTMAPAASRIRVTKSGRRPKRKASTAAEATMAARTAGGCPPEISA
jgi:hypothetical protein